MNVCDNQNHDDNMKPNMKGNSVESRTLTNDNEL